MKRNTIKSAFTLAEVMITLTVIGVITAIILPVAFHSKPDESVMKFKKAHNIFYKVMETILTSNKYYRDGDLGVKSNGTLLVANATNYPYFCNTLADILTVKKKACSSIAGHATTFVQVGSSESSTSFQKPSVAKSTFDAICVHNSAIAVGEEIVTTDNVVFYQASPQTTFGKYNTGTTRLFSPAAGPVIYPDEQGFDRIYKVMCIDIDGIGKGEAPFGYGIRADGKILTGKRADTWLDKSITSDN